MSQKIEMLDLFEDARRKINIARLALDKAIDEEEGDIGFDVAEGILLMLKEASKSMEELSGPFNEMHAELCSVFEGYHSKIRKVA